MVDWNRQQVSLTPEDLDKMTDKTVTITREIDEKTIDGNDGRKYKIFSLQVAASDKRRFTFDIFERDLEPITKIIQGQKLADELGIRLVLNVEEYTKRDKTKARKIVITRVEAPAQQTTIA